MKAIFTISLFSLALLLIDAPVYAVGTPRPEQPVETTVRPETVHEKTLNRAEKRSMRKQFKMKVREAIRSARTQAGDTDLLLLVLIAIFIPPLAMYLHDGLSNRFWISLLLTLLFFLPGMIYTLIVILGEN